MELTIKFMHIAPIKRRIIIVVVMTNNINKILLYFLNDLSIIIEKTASVNQTVYPIKLAKTVQLNSQRYEIIISKTINITLRNIIMFFFMKFHLLHNLIKNR